MSNAIRYDSLLVRELARALDEHLAGERLDAVYFDRDRLRLVLRTKPWRRRAPDRSLLWQLHPGSGHLTPAPAGDFPGRVQLGPGTRVRAVTAAPDERILAIDLDSGDEGGGTPSRIIVELITNQWNAIAVADDGRIAAVLRERSTRTRTLRAGVTYEAPPRSGRPGAVTPLTAAEWRDALGALPPEDRLAALPRVAAFASPQNAAWILAEAGVSTASAELDRAYDRYRSLIDSPGLVPELRPEDGRWQPYVRAAPRAQQQEPAPHDGPSAQDDLAPPDGPAPPDDVAPEEDRAWPDTPSPLLELFAEAARRADAAPTDSTAVETGLDAVAARLEALDRRIGRLEAERAGAAEEATRLRGQADVLMSQLHAVPRGAAHVDLPDFAGGTVSIALDPARTPADNAARLYDSARRRDRAAARIPGLVAAAQRERSRLEGLAARIRDGQATAEELAALRRGHGAPGRDAPPALPYRVYRTAGGLEVRVGRGAKSNDELTFRHSSPNDIWLHARDVAGAHVILRWPRGDANPPASDIAEAAVLAALGSRARTSGTVPVDWTRRKHVRKARKAGPGLVIPERVKTVFVEPDATVEERMRVED